MSEHKIGILGMCQAACTHTEGIQLTTGEELTINTCRTGRVCVAVSGLAARYEPFELATIGDGDQERGIFSIAREIRTEPSEFIHGALRPLDSLVE